MKLLFPMMNLLIISLHLQSIKLFLYYQVQPQTWTDGSQIDQCVTLEKEHRFTVF